MSIHIAPRPAPAPPPPAVKAGPLGPGAGVLQTEYPLASILGQHTDQDRMRQYSALAMQVSWIRAAESVIGAKLASVPWHLEGRDGDTADDGDETPAEQDARAWLERPMQHVQTGQRLTRTQFWRYTSRTMGVCGSYFWLLDQPNAYGMPLASKGIDPWRLWPEEDARGNLLRWRLDRTQTDPGIPIELDQVVHFMLEPKPGSHFGAGLVESAVLKSRITVALDQHVAQVLQAGGRLQGIVSPKTGDVMPPDVYQQLQLDARTITEQPDSARRLQIVRGPIDFTQTTMSPEALRIVELMQGYEDDLLALWGVPKSSLGLHDRGRGMGASTVTDKDDETLWQNAVIPRGTTLSEAVQSVLDRSPDPVSIVIDYPAFDDQKPAYDVATAAQVVPLTNDERRGIVGMDPIDPAVIGPSGTPLGQEVWLSNTMVLAYSAAQGADNAPAPAPAPTPAIEPAAPSDAPPGMAEAAAGEVPSAPAPAKAAPLAGAAESMQRLRESLGRTVLPGLRASVASVLSAQRAAVAASLRARAGHVAANRSDADAWWDAERWDRELSDAMRPPLMGAAQSAAIHAAALIPRAAKAGPATAVDRVLARGAARVAGINETTRNAVQAVIARGLDAGWSVLDVADYLETGVVAEGLARIDLSGTQMFDAYRSELIARTELMDAYNGAALGAYSDAGLTEVQAVDGDGDEECAARDGQIFTIDEADTIGDHPNGTLDWVPVVSSDSVAAA